MSHIATTSGEVILLTEKAEAAIGDFMCRATKRSVVDPGAWANAKMLVLTNCANTRLAWAHSPWHMSQPVHAFEALSCRWAGQQPRWSPLTLSLHFAEQPKDGTVLVGIPEEFPLTEDYFVKRVIAEAGQEYKS
jgi:hypothetical protein